MRCRTDLHRAKGNIVAEGLHIARARRVPRTVVVLRRVGHKGASRAGIAAANAICKRSDTMLTSIPRPSVATSTVTFDAFIGHATKAHLRHIVRPAAVGGFGADPAGVGISVLITTPSLSQTLVRSGMAGRANNPPSLRDQTTCPHHRIRVIFRCDRQCLAVEDERKRHVAVLLKEKPRPLRGRARAKARQGVCNAVARSGSGTISARPALDRLVLPLPVLRQYELHLILQLKCILALKHSCMTGSHQCAEQGRRLTWRERIERVRL